MPLTSEQIERYSRQIIVPRVGGRAQERLLASSICIAGEIDDVEPALLYMAGAGVGRIELALAAPGGEAGHLETSIRALNPDVTIAKPGSSPPDLLFAIIGSRNSVNQLEPLIAQFSQRPWVIARIDSPARIAVLPSPSPCPRCCGGRLLSPFGERAANARVVAMAATVEAFKLIAGYDEDPGSTLVEFGEYESHSRGVSIDPRCACGRGGA